MCLKSIRDPQPLQDGYTSMKIERRQQIEYHRPIVLSDKMVPADPPLTLEVIAFPLGKSSKPLGEAFGYIGQAKE
ncbi:hypothetical protein TNCT_81431 [Trichonephila clavata]|uniref:Uncharacterized protein n=1 Tax=Trichonephila clavata TaxID=2740835 RepID=A0A8X6KTS5_TRICU|nr:hypothetical protein TNCT_81431 [Trichonephila clavata]